MAGTDESKRSRIALTALFVLGLSATFFSCCFSETSQLQINKKSTQLAHLASSAVFPLRGNVYPLGYDFSRLFELLLSIFDYFFTIA